MENITRHNPFGTGRPLSEMVDRLFRDSVVFPRFMEGDERMTAAGVPSLYETEEGYELYVAVPGAQADKLDISLQGDVISVSGKSEWEVPEKAAAIWQGIQPREFRFAWRLPGEVEGSEVKAKLEQGILQLTLPKARAPATAPHYYRDDRRLRRIPHPLAPSPRVWRGVFCRLSSSRVRGNPYPWAEGRARARPLR